MDVVSLSAIDGGMIDLVGGKAVGLGLLIRAGERVPQGFCLTTDASARDEVPYGAVAEAWRQLVTVIVPGGDGV